MIFAKNYKEKIILGTSDDNSFVPATQQTSVLYWRLSVFKCIPYVPPHLHSTMWVMYAFGYAWIRTISPTCLMLCRVVNTERAGGAAAPPPFQFFVNQFTIFQPGGRDYAHHTTNTCPSIFSNISTALLCRKVLEPKAILCIQNLSELVNRMSGYFLFLWYIHMIYFLG